MMDRLNSLFLKLPMSKNAVEKGGYMIEKLREELHRVIHLYGITHEKTIEISQRLDIEIVKEQKDRMKKYEN